MSARSTLLLSWHRLASLLLVLAVAAPPAALALPWVIRVWQSDEGLPDNTVVGTEQTPDGFLWVATPAGLVRFDGVQFRQFTPVTTTGLATSVLQAMVCDHLGRLWVAKEQGTVVCVDQGRTATLGTFKDIPEFTAMRSISASADGQVWVVGQNGVIYPGFLSADAEWSLSDAQCVAGDPHGGVWIGTQEHGLHHWHNRAVTNSLGTTNGLAGDSVNALLATSSGQLWIGTESPDARQHAVQCWQAEQFHTFRLPPASGAVAALAVDAAGDCWVATARGLLLRVHQDVLTDETTNTLAEPHAIRVLLVSADGSLWIGYGGQGLGRLKAGRFTQYRMDQGLADDYISQILPDERGRLWLAGNTGIFSVFEKDLDDLAVGRSTRVCSVAYGRNDGLPRLQPSHGSWPGAVCAARRLFFAMQSGVAVVYANEMEENKEPPTVVLDRVSVNGRIVAAYQSVEPQADTHAPAPLDLRMDGMHLRILPGARQVEFVFTGLSFKRPDGIGFKYRLHGLDKDWVEDGTRRVASYPHIPPGDYRFQVLSCNSDGVWNETGATLALTVEPFWWERMWVRVGALLVAIGLLGGGILRWLRNRHRRQIERLELLQATERERTRIATDLHDELGARLTSISLLNSLAERDLPEPHKTVEHLAGVSRTVREATASLDELVWAIEPGNDTLDQLANYFCHYAEEFLGEASIRCQLKVPPILPALALPSALRHELFLVIKEALNNVAKHAGAATVGFGLAVAAGRLAITIEDDGRGFDADSVARGRGLANMRLRLPVIVCKPKPTWLRKPWMLLLTRSPSPLSKTTPGSARTWPA